MIKPNTKGLIVDITEVYEIRDRKERELAYYTKQLEELYTKMGFIQQEIKVTNTIIDMIEDELVLDIKEHMMRRHNQL